MTAIPKAIIAAERAIIQAVLVDPPRIDDTDGLAPTEYAHPGHQELWRIILEQDAKGALSADVVQERAIAAGAAVEQCLNDAAMQDLGIAHPDLGAALPRLNLGHYVREVREHALSRRVALVASEFLQLQRGGKMAGTALLDGLSQALAAIEQPGAGEILTVREMVKRRLADHDRAIQAESNGQIVGHIPTGIQQLDDMAFLRPGIVTAIAARPAMGKSAVGQHIACSAADAGIPVHFFSLEDGEESFTDRMLARDAVGRITLSAQRSHRLSAGQVGQLVKAGMDAIQRRNDYLLFSSLTRKTAIDCIRIARRAARRHDTRLVVIDYLQKLKRPDPRMSRFDGYGENCSDLEDAAKENGWAVLALCQVNRDVEKRPDKRPRAGDIYGSDEVTQYIKAGIGLYRPAAYDDDADEKMLELIGIKNNDGPAHWSFPVGWDGPTTRIYPWAG